MTEGYSPTSQFLITLLNEEALLDDSELGEANFQHLLAMTRDADLSNRDWAVFMLAQMKSDRADVRTTLIAAAEDEAEMVRSEAIWGLSRIDPVTALPLLSREFAGLYASMPLFNAAGVLADISLVPQLREEAERDQPSHFMSSIRDALTACETGVSDDY